GRGRWFDSNRAYQFIPGINLLIPGLKASLNTVRFFYAWYSVILPPGYFELMALSGFWEMIFQCSRYSSR
ncbi:MAG: hypothetical protein ABW158_07885, partial [Candidatus Thiodiazotropha sp. 6PDIVS]